MQLYKSSRRAETQISAAVIETLESRTLLSGLSFTNQTGFSAGAAPQSVVTGDFNHNGRLDAATVNPLANTISLLLGNGDGTFKAARTIPTGVDPVEITAASLRDNGILDLITANLASNTISVLLGNGDGTFKSAVNLPATHDPAFVIAADVNGDGKPDLIVANYGSNVLDVFLGNGDGTFKASTLVTVGNAPFSIAAADLTNDGKVDLVVTQPELNQVDVLLGNGNGTFKSPTILNTQNNPRSLVVATFNSVGFPDLAVMNSTGDSITYFAGNGNGTFRTPVIFPLANSPSSIAAADFNGDGSMDLAVGYQSASAVTIITGNGNGTFSPALHPFASAGPTAALAAADVNGDGKPDLLAISSSAGQLGVQLNLSIGGTFFGPSITTPDGADPSAIASADLNGDGIPDLVVANKGNNTVEVLLGLGNGLFSLPTIYPVDSSPTSLLLAEIGNDGHPDIVVGCSGSGTVDVLLNNGNGTFQPSISTNVGTLSPGIDAIAVADVNGDGNPDLFTAGGTTGRFDVLFGNGNGTFQPPDVAMNLPAGGDAYAVAAADLNGDGHPDLIAADSVNDTISILFGYSSGIPSVYSLSAAPAALAIADFSGDGLLDIAVTLPTAHAVAILHGELFSTFSSPRNYSAGPDPLAIAVADFNGDGRPDILVSGPTGNDLALLTGKASGFNTKRLFVDPATDGSALAVADFTRDGHPDIAAVNTVGGSITVTLNALTGGIFLHPPTTITAGNSPSSLASGDFTGNGKTDLVVASQSGYSVQILLGNGDGTFAAGQIVSIGHDVTEVLVADINGDGKPDLIVACGGFPTLFVLLGLGNGTFKPGVGVNTGVPVGVGHNALAAADLNGDGKLDLVFAQGYAAKVGFVLGCGDGTFSAPIEFNSPSFNTPTAVTIADVNGDGRPDILIADGQANKIDLLLNNGNGTFAPLRSYAAGNYPTSIAVADFNGDGHPDIAIADDQGNTITLLYGNGDGTFGPAHTANSAATIAVNNPFQIVAVDLNGDGITDLIVTDTRGVASPGNSIAVIEGNADGSFDPPIYFTVGTDPETIAVSDFNGDGYPDIAVGNTGNNTENIFLNDSGSPSAIFGPRNTLAAGNHPSAIASSVVNLNTTHATSLVVETNQYSNTVSIFLGNNAGTLQLAHTYNVAGAPTAVLLADLNGDGFPDIIVASSLTHTLTILVGNGDGTFKPPVQMQIAGSISNSASSITTADVNGDGHLDLIVSTGTSDKIAILDGNGNGTLKSPVFYNLYANSQSIGRSGAVVTGDFNGDGHPDIAVLDLAHNLIDVLLNNGDGTFAPYHHFYAAGTSLIAGDFNHDGRIDLVTTASNPGKISILLGNGDGTFAPATSFATAGEFPQNAVAADVNGDGNLDLIAADYPGIGSSYTADTIEVLPGNGNGTFAAPQSFVVGNNPIGLTLADLNNDGRLDLTTADATDNKLTVLLNSFVPTASPAIWSDPSAVFSTGSFNTFTITTSAFNPSPAISKSIILPAGLTFRDNGNGTATIYGIPTAGTGGAFTFTLTASNGFQTHATQSFTLNIHQATAITAPNRATFVTGTAGSFTVTTTGFPFPAIAIASTLPAGLTLHDNGNGTATLSGTPAANVGGVYILNINATNGVGTAASQTLTLTVDQSPAITSGTATTFTTNSGSSFTIQSTGYPAATLSESGPLPAGVTFHNNGDGTATLSGVPGASSGGTYVLSLTATNGIAPNATQSFVLTIDQPPAITSNSAATFTTGTAGSMTIHTSGFPAAAISESGSLPPGVTFHDNGNGSATFSGTPAPSAGGAYVLSLTAANGVSPTSTQNFTLTIDQAPAITSGTAATFTTGAPGSFTIHTTGFPISAIAESGVLPPGITLTDNHDGTATLSGTPAPTAGGAYVLNLTAINSIAPSATQTFTLTVDQAPAITSAAAAAFTTNSAGSFTIQTTGFPTASLGESGTLPAGVIFHDNGNGSATLSGVPASSAGGQYVLNVTANNSVAPPGAQTFTLTIDQPPAISAAGATTFTTGVAGSYMIHTTGYPAPALSVLGPLPAGVSFQDNGDGSATFSGTPAIGAAGIYDLTINATNQIAPAASIPFTLNVAVDSILSAPAATFTTGVAGSFTITTGGFSTAPTITESTILPAGLTFQDNGDDSATLSGDPSAQTGGVYTLMLSASDGSSAPATQTFALTIDQPPAITSSSAAAFSTGTAGSFTIQTTGFPISAFTESSTLPQGLTFQDNGDGSATISGTPALGIGGIYILDLTAINGTGANATQNLTLTVNQSPAITSVNSATFTTGTAGSFTITTTGFPTAAITESNPLPPGLSLHDNGDGTATLSGSPAPSTGGTYVLNFTANNGVAPRATQTFTLTVDQSPSITSSANATFTTGTAGTFMITTTGFPSSAITESTTLPQGLTLHDNGNGSATLSGTPASTSGGTYILNFTAANGIAPSATQNFTLTINQAPAITSAAATTFATGTAASFRITTTGFPAAAMSFNGTLPPGLTFHDHANGSATISGTPTVGGVYDLVLKAQTSAKPITRQDFVLTVTEPPAITSIASATFTIGAQNSYTVTTGGYPTATLLEKLPLPAGLTFHDNGNGTATLSGDPAPETIGTIALKFRAKDAPLAPAMQPFTLTIINQPTSIYSPAAAAFTTKSPASFKIRTNGYPAAAITEFGNLPPGLTFHDQGNGVATITGTPQVTGVFAIVLKAKNGASPVAKQVLTLTITA